MLTAKQQAALYYARKRRRRRATSPIVASVDPATGNQGATLDVTLAGEWFVDGAAVAFSGDGIAVNLVTRVSAAELTVNITIDAGAATTARTITVTNQDQGQGTLADAFTPTVP